MRAGVLTLHVVENPHMTLQLGLYICSSTSVDSSNLRSYSTVVHIYWKKSVCKWTRSPNPSCSRVYYIMYKILVSKCSDYTRETVDSSSACTQDGFMDTSGVLVLAVGWDTSGFLHVAFLCRWYLTIQWFSLSFFTRQLAFKRVKQKPKALKLHSSTSATFCPSQEVIELP